MTENSNIFKFKYFYYQEIPLLYTNETESLKALWNTLSREIWNPVSSDWRIFWEVMLRSVVDTHWQSEEAMHSSPVSHLPW